MFPPDQYRLLDFGAGRKLEQFGPVTTDRPSPAADASLKSNPHLWNSAHLRYDRQAEGTGTWTIRIPFQQPWTIRHGPVVLELKQAASGNLGVFPEHAIHSTWLGNLIAASTSPFRLLNLFGYTGGLSLMAASHGAHVTHVDSANSSVNWARRNAAHSGMSDLPIRWIVEDARRFVKREMKRGNSYEAIILDPPSYGHGTRGETWKLTDDLPELLADCGRLLSESSSLLCSCHTPGITARHVATWIQDRCSYRMGAVLDSGSLAIPALDGRVLDSGVYLRWANRPPSDRPMA